MHKPDFLDRFDRLVAFDAETTGKRTPDADFIRRQLFAWKPPGIIIEVVLSRCCATAQAGESQIWIAAQICVLHGLVAGQRRGNAKFLLAPIAIRNTVSRWWLKQPTNPN